MKILFLSQILPYPPDAGPRVKSWNVLRYLVKKGHDVTLVSYVRPDEKQYIPDVSQILHEVYTVALRRSRIKDVFFWFRSIISGRPFLIERDDLKEMRDLIQKLMSTEDFDFIHADQLTMAQFALSGVRTVSKKPNGCLELESTPGTDYPNQSEYQSCPELLFDAHNAVWKIVQRAADAAPLFLRSVIKRESKAILHYEGMIVREFGHTIAVSEVDRTALKVARDTYCMRMRLDAKNSEDIHVLPIAVNTKGSQIPQKHNNSNSILILGTLHYPPNADGVRWFLNEVFPHVKEDVPEANLTIVGKNPPADLIQHSSIHPESIRVTGYVQDLDPYLKAADIMVVPVRVGGGMRVRILKGFAWGIPMVTTTIGLEGIDAVPGEHILVADDETVFVKSVTQLLTSLPLRKSIREKGMRLVQERYDWDVVLKKLDEIYA